MQKYIAILRGINVSGANKIKMTDLKKELSSLNFHNLTTYIQTGNILFDYEAKENKYIAQLIKEKISTSFNLNIPVIVLTAKELEVIINQNPFFQSVEDPTKIYITYLEEEPLPSNLQKMEKINFTPDEFIIKGKAIYIYSPNGYGQTKLTNTFFESKLKVTATTRNLRTSHKLLELTSA